jgi:hypothetical protein
MGTAFPSLFQLAAENRSAAIRQISALSLQSIEEVPEDDGGASRKLDLIVGRTGIVVEVYPTAYLRQFREIL